jgi:hypothetical protein
MALVSVGVLLGCPAAPAFDPADPARGPGGMVGGETPITDGNFAGGADILPEPRDVLPPEGELTPDCDGGCAAFCDGVDLENPVNRGLCRSLWGVGLDVRPVDVTEACRRLFADLVGRFPTFAEVRDRCEGRTWGEIATELIAEEDFVRLNRRRMADVFLYNTEAVSVERIYDMDRLVRQVYEGRVAWDQFVSVASAHPVLTRRFDNASDLVEAVFSLFVGRPPFSNERTDFARLYALWTTGYYDHSALGMRLPDAFIRYRCIAEDGSVDPATRGECTSVLYGYNEVILEPDFRASPTGSGELQMWSGLLTADEWHALQLPGRVLTRKLALWEKAVEDVMVQYLGYDLGALVPEVRDALVAWLLEHDGDIRSVHHAVVTSAAYLQSAHGDTPTGHRYTYGPLKQTDAEIWIDTLTRLTGTDFGRCDHRLSRPRDFERAGTFAAYRLLEQSDWEMEGGALRLAYQDLARSLGGCPENDVSGRFRIVSILTTATQLGFVNEVCNPTVDPDAGGAAIARLLPPDVGERRAVDPELAAEIVGWQTRRYLGRRPEAAELEAARAHGEICANSRCTAEEFARPACFAILSSSEMLFY